MALDESHALRPRTGAAGRERVSHNMRAFCAALGLLLLATSTARAADAEISDFFGRWVGDGVAETETGDDTERQSRGLEVIVRAHPVGFQLCWSTIRREPGKPDRRSFAMMLFSPEGTEENWVAIFAADGSDWREWKVMDVTSGKELTDKLEWVKFSDVSWTPDNQGFFYSRYDEPRAGEEFTGTDTIKVIEVSGKD